MQHSLEEQTHNRSTQLPIREWTPGHVSFHAVLGIGAAKQSANSSKGDASTGAERLEPHLRKHEW